MFHSLQLKTSKISIYILQLHTNKKQVKQHSYFSAGYLWSIIELEIIYQQTKNQQHKNFIQKWS